MGYVNVFYLIQDVLQNYCWCVEQVIVIMVCDGQVICYQDFVNYVNLQCGLVLENQGELVKLL